MAGDQNRRGDPIPGNFMRGNGPRVYHADRASKSLARSELKGPLHGVPITIKDNLDTAGTISTGGTKGRKVLALVVVAAGEQQLFLRLAELRLTCERHGQGVRKTACAQSSLRIHQSTAAAGLEHRCEALRPSIFVI